MGTKNTNSVIRHRWPSPLKAVSAADGHIYYLINSDGSEGVANVRFIQYYSALDQFAPNPLDPSASDPDGFFFVRDAASSGPDHYGDPTVHAGWAMYIWDSEKYDPAVNNSGWVKISQQADTDWDITDELKAMFVLKTVYNVKMNEIDGNFQKFEGALINLGARVKLLEFKMNKIYPMAHEHHNIDVLNELSEPYKNILYYKNRPIGGNSYIYDHVEEVDGVKEITWCDPTLKEENWTHEVVNNSSEIAARFTNTDLARIGLTLIVVEADGSLSLFKYDRVTGQVYEGPFTAAEAVARAVELGHAEPQTVTAPDMSAPSDGIERWAFYGPYMDCPYYRKIDTETGSVYAIAVGHIRKDSEEKVYHVDNPNGETLAPKFAQTIVQDNLGLAEYVLMLPTAAKQYVGRGCWVPLQDDGVHTINHLHKCVEVLDDETGEVVGHKWTDVSNSGSELGIVGSVIDVCYAENHTMWTKNHLHFTIPEDTTKEGGIPVRWAKTTIVRKYGSAPTNANDGEVVLVVADKTQYANECFVDTVPYISHLKNDEPSYWFYRAFSTSMSGDSYQSSDGVPAKKLDWEMIGKITADGNTSLVFHVGDEIYLPHHSIFGDIPCEIVALDTAIDGSKTPGLLVVTKNLLCNKELDAVELRTSGGSVNPENIGSDEHGSNGAVQGGKHKLDTLNILRWLNAMNPATAYHQTDWDTNPSYASEDLFLAGFESLDMLGKHPVINASREFTESEMYVILPRTNGVGWYNISKTKQLGRGSTKYKWASMTGVPYSSGSRKNFKFYCSDGTEVQPEDTVGIAPMFFITGKRS